MRYCFDIDGTICYTPDDSSGKPDYFKSQPIPFMKHHINLLYNQGNYIIFLTARGMASGIDWTDHTRSQLNEWGFKYHELFKMFSKPTADIFIDDKGINVEEWKSTCPLSKGIIAGAFDILHPGYIRLFKEAKCHCNHLTVALHEDPSLERNCKLKPIHTLQERKEILNSIQYVDDIITYKYESTFLSYLDKFDMRFLGSDYSDGSYTGKDHPIPIKWISRDHSYSTTHTKNLIFDSILESNN